MYSYKYYILIVSTISSCIRIKMYLHINIGEKDDTGSRMYYIHTHTDTTHTIITVGTVSFAFLFHPVHFEKGRRKEVLLFLCGVHAVP